MLRLTNLADYAVVILLQTAQAADRLTSPAAIAATTGLPVPTIAKITGLLAKAGLVTSQRGAGGGFQLAHPADRISVAQIIEAVDGPIALTHCVETVHDCGFESACQMKAPWQVINRVVRGSLDAMSLADLVRSTAKPAVTRQPVAQQLAVEA
jgi:FeS assembly SUF system regulator